MTCICSRLRACLDAIAALTRHVPEGSQLVLSSRSHPPWPLGALRARSLVAEIGPNELSLDVAEARRAASATGLEPTDAEVAEVADHTEGWSAGVYLAALSAKVSRTGMNGVTEFRGDDRFVAEYLVSELLSRLTRTSCCSLPGAVLEPMSGALCDAVLERSGSATLLASLGDSNLFVVPLDRTGQWYRYHHLFRELLRRSSSAPSPISCRACSHAPPTGRGERQPEAAIGYAQDAGDVDRAARLVSPAACPSTRAVGRHGRNAGSGGWSHTERSSRTRRSRCSAHCSPPCGGALRRPTVGGRCGERQLRGRPARWQRLYRRVARPPPRAALSVGAGSMRADAELAVRTRPWSPFRPHALGLVAISRWLTGDGEEADGLFSDVAEAALELPDADVATVALGERAALALARGAWVQGEEHATSARRIIGQYGIEDHPTSALALAVGARVALNRGDRRGAGDLMARVQCLRPQLTHAMPYYAVQTRLELARAYLALADAGGAETVLREVDAVLRRQPDLGTLPAQVDELRTSVRAIRADAPGVSTLTEAELRLLPYLATHLSFREIGDRLFVSRHTVKSHAMAVYRKLNVSSRSAAVERARQLRLI